MDGAQAFQLYIRPHDSCYQYPRLPAEGPAFLAGLFLRGIRVESGGLLIL